MGRMTARMMTRGWRAVVAGLCMGIVVLCLTLGASVPAAFGIEGATLTDRITDPENLLGANAAEVTDAMDETERTTGVEVRLLYLDSFNAGEDDDPAEWARGVLEATKPDPNTVLLAVATDDGNLVVVVSSNSEGWLRDQDTVDALSEAAAKPLSSSGERDWSAAAITMMDQLKVEWRSRGDAMTSTVLIWVGCGAGALIVLAVVVAVVRSKCKPRKDTEVSSDDTNAADDKLLTRPLPTTLPTVPTTRMTAPTLTILTTLASPTPRNIPPSMSTN